MDLILIAAIAFAMSQVILSGLLLWQQKAWSVQRAIYGVLLVCVAAYLIQPFVDQSAWALAMLALQTAVPGLFWLFSASLFDDHFQLKVWKVVVVLATVALPLLGGALRSLGVDPPGLLLFALPQLAEFFLVSLTLFVVARHWRGDLVAPRRRLRLWFCALNGLYILLLILFREVVFPEETALANWQYLPIGGLLLATNAILLDYKQGVFPSFIGESKEQNSSVSGIKGSAGSTAITAGMDVPAELLEKLNRVMEEEELFCEMGLTIGHLAAVLEVPEYRLRQVINQALGYRNFNDFLNTWRVRKAASRLLADEDRHLPILTIAMDSGYRSLSSFNKAFREQYGETPTSYRRGTVKP